MYQVDFMSTFQWSNGRRRDGCWTELPVDECAVGLQQERWRDYGFRDIIPAGAYGYITIQEVSHYHESSLNRIKSRH